MLSRKKFKSKSITGKIPLNTQSTTYIKPKKARKIIRRYHHLTSKKNLICSKLTIKINDNNDYNKEQIFNNDEMEKALLNINNINDKEKLLECLNFINFNLFELGGINDYQKASTSGQDPKRGGDSSKLLIEWMKPILKNIPISDNKKRRTALEIGSLSIHNKISTSNIFDVTRIDLENSNDIIGIEKQDFMKRPIPNQEDNDKFDLVSCSLVLNFVPTPAGRGEMCKRFRSFLNKDGYVFVVLPLPCITNSRYMNRELFNKIMKSLGYEEIQYKLSKKLCYFLFQMKNDINKKDMIKYQKKIKIRDEPGMNNFSIILNDI